MTHACLAHLPNPTPPRRRPLAGATDCHTHVILAQTQHPFVANRSYTPPPATLQSLKALHRTLGIDRAVIVQPSIYGTDNQVTLDAISGYGSTARGIAVVDADVPKAELDRLHAGGIRGVRINMLFAGGVGLEALDPLAQRIADLGWHVQLLIDGPTLADLETHLARLPVPTVIDHMGHMKAVKGLNQDGFRALLRLVARGKTWVKLSGPYRLSAQHPAFQDVIPFAQALIAENPDHVVWGSDWPDPGLRDGMPDDGPLLDALETYVGDDAEKHQILIDNPARLYGFDP